MAEKLPPETIEELASNRLDDAVERLREMQAKFDKAMTARATEGLKYLSICQVLNIEVSPEDAQLITRWATGKGLRSVSGRRKRAVFAPCPWCGRQINNSRWAGVHKDTCKERPGPRLVASGVT